METVKLKARVCEKSRLEWVDPQPDLPEGEVEVILVYSKVSRQTGKVSEAEWPSLHGGRYRGGSLRREDLYDDDGR